MFILKLELFKRKLRLLQLDCELFFLRLENKCLDLLCYIKYDLLVAIEYKFKCLIYGREKYNEMLWKQFDDLFEDKVEEYNNACEIVAKAFSEEV
jgi:hypothetical protein